MIWRERSWPSFVPYHSRMSHQSVSGRTVRVGMVGLGMIFEETYRPFFDQTACEGLFRRDFGRVGVELAATATRTGNDPNDIVSTSPQWRILPGRRQLMRCCRESLQAVCVATPDDRHFDAAPAASQPASTS